MTKSKMNVKIISLIFMGYNLDDDKLLILQKKLVITVIQKKIKKQFLYGQRVFLEENFLRKLNS